MKRFFSLTALLFLVTILTTISYSQTERPGWLVSSANKVDTKDMAKLNELDSIAIPILQGFVDDGTLFTFGRMDHAWGDEWNVHYYYVTKDAQTFFDFWSKYMEKLQETLSEKGFNFRSLLQEHKDNMYSIQSMKFNRDAALEHLPLFLAMNQNIISMADFEKFDEMDKMAEPILDDLMNEGHLLGYGRLDHAWGDEWNLNYYMITKDHETFLKTWREYLKRLNEKHPEMGTQFRNLTKAHKDNMYLMRYVAERKAE